MAQSQTSFSADDKVSCLSQKQVDLYKAFISEAQQSCGLMKFVDGIHQDLLCHPLSIEVLETCSCGRFFEQHPTIIEDTEDERFQIFLQALLQGCCKCLVLNPDLRLVEGRTRFSSKTWLHVTAALGNLKLMEAVFKKSKIDLNSATSLYQHTPLSLAVMQTKGDLVKWLCSLPNIDPNVKSKSERHTPLVDAILAEKYHIVEILVQATNIDLNAKNFRAETPLIIATKMHNSRLVKILLAAGADHSLCASDGTLPILLAINHGPQVVKEYVKAAVPLNSLDSQGESALTLAIRNRYTDIVAILVEGGADCCANPAQPAITLAAYLGYMDVLAYLLNYGAQDPDQSDTQGWTALHFASMKGFPRPVALLLDRDANPNKVSLEMVTPLSLAIYFRQFIVAELLQAYGSDVNMCDLDLDTPLHVAAFHGDTDVVQSLLNNGSNACAMNRIGATPLFNATLSGTPNVVKLLLPHYTDSCLHADSQGFSYTTFSNKVDFYFPVPRSPLWAAASLGNEAGLTIVQLLLIAGYDASKEDWIRNHEFPDKLQNEFSLSFELKDLLLENACNPRTLMTICRCVVRRTLGPGGHRKVNQLCGVPRKIKNYILLRQL